MNKLQAIALYLIQKELKEKNIERDINNHEVENKIIEMLRGEK